jgi:anti-sigma B factor antagonist
VSHIQVEVTEDGSAVSVALIGELDISETNSVQEMLADVERRHPPLILLDLRRLSFLDSSGLRLILEADLRAREDGRRVSVVRGPESVHRVFTISLLDKRLDFVEDPAEVEPA